MYEYELAQQRIADLHEEARRDRLAAEVARASGFGTRHRRGRRRLLAAGSARPLPEAKHARIPHQRRPAEVAGRRS
jgi:hypothetical protein